MWQQTVFPLLHPATLIVVNKLLIVTPLEALAETCEVDKPDFIMPLFTWISNILEQ